MTKSKEAVVTVVVFILVSVALVGFTYAYTAGPIYAHRAQAAVGALRALMPGIYNTTYNTLSISSLTRAERAYNEEGAFLGHAVTASPMGYGGPINMMTAFDPQGTILGVQILRHSETRGIGSLIEGSTFTGQFAGMSGMVFNQDIDSITGATISVNAVLQGINDASVHLGFARPGAMPPVPAIPPDSSAVAGLIPGTRFTEFIHVDEFTVDWLALAYDRVGSFLGYVYFASPRGFGGEIEMAVALDADGIVQNMLIFGHRETWNFGGSVMNDPAFPVQFIGRRGEFERQHVDMVSMATISIDSVLRALNDISHHFNRR